MAEKDDSIEELQKRVARLNAVRYYFIPILFQLICFKFINNNKNCKIKERNGYKKIVDSYDAESTTTDVDITKKFFNRINHLEDIINEYKKSTNEQPDLKLRNNSSFHLEEVKIKTD